jgi:hypothetical protein
MLLLHYGEQLSDHRREEPEHTTAYLGLENAYTTFTVAGAQDDVPIAPKGRTYLCQLQSVTSAPSRLMVPRHIVEHLPAYFLL